MKKILVVTTNLDLGGITTFVVNLVNFLANEGYKVTLMYTNDQKKIINRISPSIELVKYSTLSKKEIVFKALLKGFLFDLLKVKFRNHSKISPISSTQKIHYINAIHSPKNTNAYDIAISSAEFFCNNYVALNTNAKRKIGWIHPDYESLNVDVTFDRKTLDLLDIIVTVSKDCKKALLRKIPDYKKKVLMVQNILDHKSIIERSKDSVEDFDFNFKGLNIVTVCRLDNSSKRVDRAITACKYLLDNKINIKWYLIGEGKDKEELEKKVVNLGIQEHFIMLGARSNPYPYIKNADLFILTSQYEGKPIVVNEALILKCPVIVTNYKSAKEQLPSEFGQVISNNDDLVSGELLQIICDKEKVDYWKNNLKSFQFDNSETYCRIRKLIEEGKND